MISVFKRLRYDVSSLHHFTFSHNLYSVCCVLCAELCVWLLLRLTSSVLCDEWILYRFHTVLWTNQHHRCSTAHHQPKIPRVLGQLKWLVVVTQIFCCVVQHQIQQRIVTFQHTSCLSTAGKFHANRLLQIFTQVQNGLFATFLFIVTALCIAARILFAKKNINAPAYKIREYCNTR